MKKCTCGSGKEREAQFDGYGIFLCYTCDDCHKERMSMYRKDIKQRYTAEEPIDED